VYSGVVGGAVFAKRARVRFFAAILFLLPVAPLCASGPDAAWEAVKALDAGPGKKPRTPEEALAIASEYVQRQERLLRDFLRQHPGDERGFEARLRLARVLQMQADLYEKKMVSPEVETLLSEAEKMARPEQRADAEFARISYTMRTLRNPNFQQRQRLLDLARRFQALYPQDRRLAPLLAEIATRFDLQPRAKRELLQQARDAARDQELRARIDDDLRRLNLLGERIAMRFEAPDGTAFDVADHRGKVVVLVFFATWSPPSIEALAAMREALAGQPAGKVQFFGVSLDLDRVPLEGYLRSEGIGWPVICDGLGWESPLVRQHGINALPTAWLLDREGRLRSLDAAEGTAGQVREILQQR
jgi:thiol-disulfide isomerase/thioredoxin